MATKFEVVLTAKLSNSSLSEIRKQISELSKGTKIDIKVDNSYLKSITSEMSSFSNVVKEAKAHTQGLNEIMQKFSSWSIGTSIIRESARAMQDMVQQVFDLDASLVEFNKVTDVTPGQLKQITNEAYNLGEQLARTGKETIDAATEFSKAGYKENAMELAKTALLYQNIADEQVSTSTATSLIVSQMKAFNVEAEDSIKIIDQINEVNIRASRYSNVA